MGVVNAGWGKDSDRLFKFGSRTLGEVMCGWKAVKKGSDIKEWVILVPVSNIVKLMREGSEYKREIQTGAGTGMSCQDKVVMVHADRARKDENDEAGKPWSATNAGSIHLAVKEVRFGSVAFSKSPTRNAGALQVSIDR